MLNTQPRVSKVARRHILKMGLTRYFHTITRLRNILTTSLIIASKAAVSSACFWLCKAIFSLNFRGFAMMAENDNLVVILAMQGVLRKTDQSNRPFLVMWYFPCDATDILRKSVNLENITVCIPRASGDVGRSFTKQFNIVPNNCFACQCAVGPEFETYFIFTLVTRRTWEKTFRPSQNGHVMSCHAHDYCQVKTPVFGIDGYRSWLRPIL